MDSMRNLPVYLHYEEDGTVSARCPLLPALQCRSATRALALGTMQQLLRRTSEADAVPRAQKYEVVFLAVAPSSDSSPSRRRGRRRATPQ